MRFNGKRIVVTGAGTGIGAAAAKMFLEQGAEVIAVQNVAPAPHASSRITMNLGNADSIAAACEKLPDKIDILCNIAGLGADDNTPEAIIGVNFIGTRMFTEHMLSRISPEGCVLNTASASARYWRRDVDLLRQIMAMDSFEELGPFWASLDLEHQMSYLLAKAAVVTWTMKLAHAHIATGPRINVISPGFTDTPMLQRAFANANESVKQLAQSNNSINTPEEVARVVIFLCSEEARVINGAELCADAGLIATFNCNEYGI
jgi:NAD(P)-dependent dehydrogenase (short-subunit alcohol dehydrogenase family)